jgi:hypothetical protein
MPPTEPDWNFEQEPWDEPHDESSINLRAYFDRMPDAKLLEYRPEWTDARVLEWDGNFKSDGSLLLPCSERGVEIAEYRKVLEQNLRYREKVRGRP